MQASLNGIVTAFPSVFQHVRRFGRPIHQPRLPLLAHVPGSSKRDSLHNIPSPGVVPINRVGLNNATQSSAMGSWSAQADHIFHLLCVTVGGASALEHLSIADLKMTSICGTRYASSTTSFAARRCGIKSLLLPSGCRKRDEYRGV